MGIQTTGYIVMSGKKILVLVQEHKIYRSFKLRYSGKDGFHFSAEEYFLRNHPRLVEALLDEKVISIQKCRSEELNADKL